MGPTQHRDAEVDGVQSRATQVGVLKNSPSQRREGQVTPTQDGLGEVGLGQVGIAQPDTGEVQTAQVRPAIRTLPQ